MNTEVSVLRCECGQRSWIPAYSFNRPENLRFGTPYRCPQCKEPLGESNFIVIGIEERI